MKFSVVLLLLSITLRADIHTDLQNLSTQGNALNTELSAFTFNQESSCMKLGTLNRSLEDYTAALKSTTETMTAFSVTEADLIVLDDLSVIVKDMGQESLRLTAELNTIEDVAELFEYRAGLSAMLQLSNDIGTMANRILEMSDRILIMADNIGLMADRILITQQIQNTNIALTQASILTTQQNMVLLSDSLSTIAYNLTLGQILNDADDLSGALNTMNLDSNNMDSALASLETQTTALLNKTTNLLLLVVENSQAMSHYINSDTLTMLGDLTAIHKALALSLETYAHTIEQLAPLTQTPVLSDATTSMLQLTKDIGVMSDRIMEMTNDISIMADNIGLMADNIVATQDIQNTNVLLTESSLLTSQSIMINVIKNFGL
jgi:hypothetical protein